MFRLTVTSATWSVTATHLKKTMKPWVQSWETPAFFPNRSPPPTLWATTLFQTVMALCSASRAWTQRSTSTLGSSPSPASAHPSPLAACQLGTAPKLLSRARHTAAGSTQVSPAVGRDIPTACRPVWARKITPAVLERAASPDASSCPSPALTAAWAA